MSDSPDRAPGPDPMAQAAAEWVLRCDRGLTPTEQDEFSSWLAADARHRAQLARHRRHWQRLDQLAQWRPEHGARPNPDLLAPSGLRRFTWRKVSLAALAAAAVAVLFLGIVGRTPPPVPRPASAVTSLADGRQVLEDGSVVELNDGAEVRAEFTPGVRRVRLVRGEAHFTVEKNPLRPFVVVANGIEVRAVGTAFNVRLDAAAVEVLVTEGRVRLDHPAPAATREGPAEAGKAADAAAILVPVLEARQRAVVSTVAAEEHPQIATLTTGEIARVLAWQQRVLSFTKTPLAEVVAAFNDRNTVKIAIADPELAAMRVSASFRPENIEGFVHLLESGFGVTVDRRGEREIVIRRADPAAK